MEQKGVWWIDIYPQEWEAILGLAYTRALQKLELNLTTLTSSSDIAVGVVADLYF